MGRGAVCTFATLLCFAAAVLGAGIKMPKGMEPEKGKKSDVKYIRCAACEHLAKNAYRMAKEMREELAPGKKLSEYELIEKVEKLSKPSKDEGEWIAALDMVEEGDRIKLVEMDDLGKCGVECNTIAMAVDDILDRADTDMAEKLWQGKSTRAQFQNWLCYEATNSCAKKPPPVPKTRVPGPAFVAQDQKERDLAKMMDNMKEMGMGGTLYDREAMMKGYMGMGGDDDDDDDDDDAANTPSASEVAKEPKGSPAASSGQSTLEKAKEAGAAALDAAKEGVSGIMDRAKKLASGLGFGAGGQDL